MIQYYFCFMFWFFDLEACGIFISPTGDRTHTLHGKVKALTTGQPGKSLKNYFLKLFNGSEICTTWSYHFNYLCLHSSVALLCNHHRHSSPELFPLLQIKLCPHETNSSFHSPQTLAATALLSCLCGSDCSRKLTWEGSHYTHLLVSDLFHLV